MATTAIVDTEPKLTPAVRSLLGSLRAWIRVYVCVEGVAASATWLGGAFWASLVVDWFFEPPPWVRGVMLAAVALVLAGVLVQLIGRRVFARLSNSNMAMVLERRFPELDDSLLTAVALTGRRPASGECNRQMLAHTCGQATERIGQVELRKVFNPRPLGWSITGSTLFSVSVVLFALLFPAAFGTWARRSLLFSSELWPRKTYMEIEGFEDGVEKVARGADFEVLVKAHTRWPPDHPRGRLQHPIVPHTVQIRYRIEGGRRGRKSMQRLGKARTDGEEPFQEYVYTFEGILAPHTFSIKGNDHVLGDFRIEVVDSPTLGPMKLHCKYPAYTGLNPRTLSVPAAGKMQIPRGTEVTVHAQANKDLVGLRVDCTVGDESLSQIELQRRDLADDGRSFTYTLPSLDGDTTLLFTLSDTDGITSREPVPLTLAVVNDYPPQLTARLNGIGTAITPEARLPVVGQITDDYGIARVWFEYAADQQEPSTHLLSVPDDHPATFLLKDVALEVRDLKPGTDGAPTGGVGRLVAGQKLLVGVKAADLYDLGDDQQPNVGTSERWLLDLVTPDQLRAMLESRELVLRQRFEAIIQEVTETRDLLLRVEFGPSDTAETPTETAAEKAGSGAEPGDEPEELSPERQLGLRIRRVHRALTNCGKNAHETQSVADGFDDIRLQLINNRIDTEELIRRLEEGIVGPLHHIAQEMFPLLQTHLEQLEQNLEDEKLGLRHRDRASRQANAILLEMRKVLERMIELEDFNEAVELLRMIIKLQEQLEEQTKQRHKQRIRELLED